MNKNNKNLNSQAQPKPLFILQYKLLLAITLVALLPVIFFGAMVYYQARDSIVSKVGEQFQAGSHLAISQLERSFYFSLLNVRSWAQLDVMQQVGKADPKGELSRMLFEYQHSWGYYSHLVVADLKGKVVAAGDNKLVGVSVADSPWFQETLTSGKAGLGDLRFDAGLGSFSVPISVPIYRKNNSDKMIGILNAGFSWSELRRLVNAIEVVEGAQNEKGYALLVDKQGYIIAGPEFIFHKNQQAEAPVEPPQALTQKWWPLQDPQILETMLHTPSHRYLEAGEQRLLVVNQPTQAYQVLSNLDWSLLLVRDAWDALATLESVRQRFIILALIGCLLIFVAAVIVARRTARPILALVDWAKQVASGNLNNEVRINSKDEIGQLGHALNNMRLDLKKNLDELYAAKDNFQSLINSLDCIVMKAEVNPVRVVSVNGQGMNVFGLSNQKLLANMAHWENWVHPDHVERLNKILDQAVNSAQDQIVEFKARHGDGSWVWMKAFVSVEIKGLHVAGLRGVMVDISDVIHAAEEMREAHDIAVRTADNKSRFLAIISHEIRTPMNGLLGMLEMLRDSKLAEEQHQQVELAWKSGKNLLTLINDVMDFSRLETDEIEFHYEWVNVQQLLNDQLALVVPEAYRKGLDIGMAVEANMPERVHLDLAKVRRVVSALLSNAVKFTAHGSVLVWAELLADKRLYVEIKDTGLGVATESQKEIFNPFVQEDFSTTRRFEGSGLGLALCRRIIEAMDGTLGVKSIAGVGSSFYFEVPVLAEQQKTHVLRERLRLEQYRVGGAVLLIGDLPATKTVLQIACQQWHVDFDWQPKEARLLRDLQKSLSEKHYQWIFIAQEVTDRFWDSMNHYLLNHPNTRMIQLRLPTETYGQRPLPHLYVPFTKEELLNCMLDVEQLAHQQQNLSLAKESKVLVVDDNPVNRQVAAGLLKKLGIQADHVEDGAQAVAAATSCHYDLVLMDCQMPVMDGYEATRQIRSQLKGRFLPIVAVTANAMQGDREHCLAAGMNDYMAKPLRKEALQQMLVQWLDPVKEQTS